jgi:AbrB family looped-hinge helix DNA binding protein
MRVKVSKRHQVALPSVARQALGISAGDRLLVDVQDNLIILLPEPASYTARLAGLHRAVWADVGSAVYLAEERAAWRDPTGEPAPLQTDRA